MTMKKLAIAAALAACFGTAQAQVPTPAANPPQVSTSGNFGRLTISSGSVLSGTYTTQGGVTMGDFSMTVQADFSGVYTSAADVPPSSGGYTFDNIVWTFSGQNGPGPCSGRGCQPPTYRTYVPDIDPADGTVITPPLVYLMTAQPAVDDTGNPVMGQGFCGASPCMLQQWNDVAPATFADVTPAAFVHSSVSCQTWGSCDVWTLNGHLPAGQYNVYITGSACGLRACSGVGIATLFLTANISTTYVPPASPPPPVDN
jgi:hypothetical protein